MDTNPKSSGWRGGVLLSILSLLVIVASLEGIGYLWERKTGQGELGWTLVASRRIQLEQKGTEAQPYYLLSPNQQYRWRDIPVHTNSIGMRGDDLDGSNPGVRILNIGDSVAFGWAVPFGDTYGVRLERMLEQELEGVDVQLNNAGVPGATVELEKNFLLQEGFSLDPDIILLELTLVNDIYGGGPAQESGVGLFDWLRDHTYSWPFLTTQARFLMSNLKGPEAIPVLNPPKEARAYFPLEADDPAWDRVWMDIEVMYQESKARGIPMILLVFPTAYQVNSAHHPDLPQRILSQKAAELGLPMVDLLPDYRSACDRASAESCEGYENLLFADVWMHPNSYGHQLAAEAAFSVLRQQVEELP